MPVGGGAYRSTNVAPNGLAFGKVPIDTLDPAYTNSVALVSNGLIIRGSSLVQINVQCRLTDSVCTTQIRINGSTVATGNTAQTSTASYQYTASDGDQIQMWQADTGNFLTRIVSGAANSFIHYEPVVVGADSGAAGETASVAAAVPATDTGTAADTAAARVSAPSEDSATSTDAAAVRASAIDTATAAEVAVVAASTGAADSATVVDAAGLLLASADAGIATEAATQGIGGCADAGAFQDSATVRVWVPAEDSGAWAESGLHEVPVADTATFTDTATVGFPGLPVAGERVASVSAEPRTFVVVQDDRTSRVTVEQRTKAS